MAAYFDQKKKYSQMGNTNPCQIICTITYSQRFLILNYMEAEINIGYFHAWYNLFTRMADHA